MQCQASEIPLNHLHCSSLALMNRKSPDSVLTWVLSLPLSGAVTHLLSDLLRVIGLKMWLYKGKGGRWTYGDRIGTLSFAALQNKRLDVFKFSWPTSALKRQDMP